MTRVQTHSNPVADECGEAKTGHVVVGVFVVSGGDAAKVLEAPEHTLNDVSVSISFSVEGMALLAVTVVGNYRLDVPALQPGSPVVGVVGFVGQEVTGIGQATGEHNRARDIGGLTGRQVERQRSAMLIAYGVDLGVAASLGAADGL